SARRGPGAVRRPGGGAPHRLVRGRVAARVRARDQGVLRAAVRPRPARAYDMARRAALAAVLRAGRATRGHAAGADAGRLIPGTAAPRRALVTRVDYDRRLYSAYRDGRALSDDTGRLWMAAVGRHLGRVRGSLLILDLRAGTRRVSTLLADALYARGVRLRPSP